MAFRCHRSYFGNRGLVLPVSWIVRSPQHALVRKRDLGLATYFSSKIRQNPAIDGELDMQPSKLPAHLGRSMQCSKFKLEFTEADLRSLLVKMMPEVGSAD